MRSAIESVQTQVQIDLFSPNSTPTTLLRKIEQATSENSRVVLVWPERLLQSSLTAWQALDLLLVEHVLTNPNTQHPWARLSVPEFSYLLPDHLSQAGSLQLVEYLQGLASHQKQGQASVAQAEVSDLTLLPITPLHASNGSPEQVITQLQEILSASTKGLPGMEGATTHLLNEFFREGITNAFVHSIPNCLNEAEVNTEKSIGLTAIRGYLAANRTYQHYQDRTCNQSVTIYTIYAGCYDFGVGIPTSLSSKPEYSHQLLNLPDTERNLAALQMVCLPKPDNSSPSGLYRLVNLLRTLPVTRVEQDGIYTYRVILRLISNGVYLEHFYSATRFSFDRPLLGTQLQLQIELIYRSNVKGQSPN
ncbi:MAG: hypothetical protein HXX20_00090 [Chloroflexi bacterium]|nr:hypothetical protein [Chloroflexota bacterium]